MRQVQKIALLVWTPARCVAPFPLTTNCPYCKSQGALWQLSFSISIPASWTPSCQSLQSFKHSQQVIKAGIILYFHVLPVPHTAAMVGETGDPVGWSAAGLKPLLKVNITQTAWANKNTINPSRKGAPLLNGMGTCSLLLIRLRESLCKRGTLPAGLYGLDFYCFKSFICSVHSMQTWPKDRRLFRRLSGF